MVNLFRNKKFIPKMNEHSFNNCVDSQTNADAFIYLHLGGDVL